ncbi:MAG: O-antigen ligase family protein [Anaerolineae bacterium]|jgi:hypothetical protein
MTVKIRSAISARSLAAYLLLAVLLAAGAGAAVAFRIEIALITVAAGLVAALALLLWRHPYLGILAVVWLMPLHSLMLAGLVSVEALPNAAVEAFKLWKLGLVLLLIARLWWSGRQQRRVTWLDLAIGLFFAIEALYLLLPAGPELYVRLFAIQFDSLFLLFYVLGRLFPYSYRQFRGIILSLLAVGALAAALALVEIAFFREFMFSFRDYFAYLGKEVDRWLPVQFYTYIGGTRVQRPGSIYLNPIEFSFALLVPLTLGWGLAIANAYRPLYRLWLTLLAMLGGLLVALSRSAMVALALGLAFVLLLRQRMPRWFLVLIAILLVAALAAAAILRLDQLVLDTINLAEPSAVGHVLRWQGSVETMQEAPLGLGLGNIGPVARRFVDSEALINESWYFQIATEMGIPTGLLFAAIMALLVVQSLLIWPAMPDRFLRATVLGFAGAAVALSVTALFLHTWSYDAVAFPFWLLAGLVVQLPERVRQPGWLPNRPGRTAPSGEEHNTAGHGGGP